MKFFGFSVLLLGLASVFGNEVEDTPRTKPAVLPPRPSYPGLAVEHPETKPANNGTDSIESDEVQVPVSPSPPTKPRSRRNPQTRDFPSGTGSDSFLTRDAPPAPSSVTLGVQSSTNVYDLNFSSSSTSSPSFSTGTGDANQNDFAFSTNPQTKDDSRQFVNNDPRFCTKNHDPICGSNGKTYANMCVFTQEQRNDPSINVLRRGEC